MMKSVRSRLTVTFIGLIAVILAVIWGVNKWYLEDFYVTKKVQALNAMYTAIDAQIAENKDNGITIEEAMERERKHHGRKLTAPDPELQRQCECFGPDH